jgi:hypothetical protein
MIRSLVLGGSIAIGAGCDGTGGSVPLAWTRDPGMVERMAPGCLEAGHDTRVCGCTLHHMANAMKSPGTFPFELLERTDWPGSEGGLVARWHASCETWARTLGLLQPQVAAGPPT